MALLIKLFSSFLAVIELYEQQHNVNLALQSKRCIMLFFTDKFLLTTGIFSHRFNHENPVL